MLSTISCPQFNAGAFWLCHISQASRTVHLLVVMEPHTSEGMPIEMWNTRMKAIHALIPATLLAGTVLSGPVEANGTANAWSAVSRQDYYIVMNAKRHDKIIKVGRLNAHKKAPAAGKETKKVVETLDIKRRKKLRPKGGHCFNRTVPSAWRPCSPIRRVPSSISYVQPNIRVTSCS